MYESETAVVVETFFNSSWYQGCFYTHQVGTVESFNSLDKATQKFPIPAQQKMDAQQMQQIAERVSKFVKSCSLSRAINLLVNVPPPAITSVLTDKIRELHPTAQPEHRIPDSAPSITIVRNKALLNESHLAKVKKKFEPPRRLTPLY